MLPRKDLFRVVEATESRAQPARLFDFNDRKFRLDRTYAWTEATTHANLKDTKPHSANYATLRLVRSFLFGFCNDTKIKRNCKATFAPRASYLIDGPVAQHRRDAEVTDPDRRTRALRAELAGSVRERLSLALRSLGAWIDDERFNTLRERSRRCGRAIEDGLVAGILGPQDHAYLYSEGAFGTAGAGPGRRLPLVLSFGFYLGAGLHDRLGLPEAERDEAGRLCALFNLMSMLFDRTIDDVEGGLHELSPWFGRDTMRALSDHPARACQLADTAATAALPELRILLKIIAGFYRQAAAIEDAAGWARLNEKLAVAYGAEMDSLCGQAASAEAAAGKTLALFDVMLAIAQSRGADVENGPLQAFVDNLGRLFWLLDDQVDLVRDVGAGHANSIVSALRAAKPRQATESEEDLLRLLIAEPAFIDAALERLASRIAAFRRDLAAAADWPGAAEFEAVILMYLRGACQ